MLNSLLKQCLFSLMLIGVAASAVAHKYYFGITELSINPKTQHIEVIHQFTAHDIENTIAEIQQVNFSPEHPKYDEYIQAYFERHFILEQNQQEIALEWIGLEIKLGKMFIYQESRSKNKLASLVVKNSLLVDTYAKQVNSVNYQENALAGSLTFTDSHRIDKIDNNN